MFFDLKIKTFWNHFLLIPFLTRQKIMPKSDFSLRFSRFLSRNKQKKISTALFFFLRQNSNSSINIKSKPKAVLACSLYWPVLIPESDYRGLLSLECPSPAPKGYLSLSRLWMLILHVILNLNSGETASVEMSYRRWQAAAAQLSIPMLAKGAYQRLVINKPIGKGIFPRQFFVFFRSTMHLFP